MAYVLDTYIRYEIAGGNVGDVFTIDSDTGDVSLAKPLDYETRKQVCSVYYNFFLIHAFFKRICGLYFNKP